MQKTIERCVAMRASDPHLAVWEFLEEMDSHPAIRLPVTLEQLEVQLLEAARRGDHQLELAMSFIART